MTVDTGGNGFGAMLAVTLIAAAGVVQKAGRQLAADLGPWARGGLIDLQNAVVHAFPDSLHQAEVPGMFGIQTQAENLAARTVEPEPTSYERWLSERKAAVSQPPVEQAEIKKQPGRVPGVG